MEPFTLLAFTLALTVAVATPGPGMTAIVARALGTGFRATLPMVAGLVIGDLVLLTAAVFGLAAIAQSFGLVFTVIKYLGAAYLLYLAVKLWTTKAEGLNVEATKGVDRPWRTMMSGLSLTLGNPKTIVFYLALLPSIVDLESLTALGYLEIVALVIVVLSIIAIAYAAAAARARAFFRNPRSRRLLDRTAGTMMVGAAVAVVSR